MMATFPGHTSAVKVSQGPTLSRLHCNVLLESAQYLPVRKFLMAKVPFPRSRCSIAKFSGVG